MRKRTLVFCTALLGTSGVAAPGAARADDGNKLTDASFEIELPPDQRGWELFGRSRFSSDESLRGGQSMFNGASSRRIPYPPFLVGTVSGSFQEFPAAPGSQWRLTGYGLTRAPLSGAPAFGIVQVSFFDADGNDLGTVETADSASAPAKISNEVNSRSPVGEWIFLDTDVATAPEDAATVQAFTLYVDYSGSNIFQGVFFDALNLCAVEGDDQSACEPVDGAHKGNE